MGGARTNEAKTTGFTREQWRAIILCGIVFFLNTAPQGFMFAVITPVMEELGISRVQFGTVVGISTLAGGIVSTFAGKIMASISPRRTMMTGSLLIIPFALLLGLANNLPVLVLAGLVLGCVVALGTVGVASAVLRENLGARMVAVFGLLSGIAFLSQACVGAVMGAYIPTYGYRPVVIILGIVISLVGALLTLGLPKQGLASAPAPGAAGQAPAELPGLMLDEARRTQSFWIFGIATFLSAMLFSGLVLYIIDFFVQNGMAYPQAATMYSLLTIASAITTAFSGFFVRKAGIKRFLYVMLIGYAVGILVLALGFPASGGVVAVALVGMVLCALVRPINITPGLVVGDLFGPKDYAAISTYMMFFFMAGGGTVSIVLGGMVDIFKGDYTLPFVVMSVLSIASLALFLISVRLSPMMAQNQS